MIVIAILVLVYFILPFWLQLIISVANFFIPDPIPIIDEALMIAGLLSKLNFLEGILENILGVLIVLGLIALVIFFVIPNVSALFSS